MSLLDFHSAQLKQHIISFGRPCVLIDNLDTEFLVTAIWNDIAIDAKLVGIADAQTERASVYIDRETVESLGIVISDLKEVRGTPNTFDPEEVFLIEPDARIDRQLPGVLLVLKEIGTNTWKNL